MKLPPAAWHKGREWPVLYRSAAAGAREIDLHPGDVVVRGRNAADDPWRVGIQHPWERDKVAEVVTLTRGAVATSGRTERGDHVIDPRTGRAAAGRRADRDDSRARQRGG